MKDILKWSMYGAVFAVPFVLLIVSSSMFFPYITGKNFAFRILVEIGFAAWALLALIDKSYRPRFSWILAAVAGLLAVMFAADLLGEYAPKSFWSNFERMEGWTTLFHFFLYFTVLGSVLRTEKLWRYFMHTALAAAGIMAFYALAQVAGVVAISQGGEWRVDATLGNSTYLGVYMLFHLFICAWLFIRTKSSSLRYLYAGLFLLFAFILFQTGTRGTVLGLIGGSALTFGYLALMAPRGAAIKKWALGGLVAVVLGAGGIWALRDTAFVQESPVLSRFAGITLAEGGIRFLVWQVALEGVKEHPILGWGQENFSYVFNKYYDPALYAAEQWYDRTHNIFFDWLIAGGVVGLLSYLSILLAALWYAVLAPAWTRLKKGAKEAAASFSVPEQALLLGLLAAYTFHNLFVFDNLASWIFYAMVLALVHSRVSQPINRVEGWTIDKGSWERIAVPTGAAALCAMLYFANVPSILAAQDIIKAYRATEPSEQLRFFEDALARGSLGHQEVVEQMSQVGSQLITSDQATAEEKQAVYASVVTAFDQLLDDKPNDARLHLILASFYRAAGRTEEALAQFNTAEKLSPQKQAIIADRALIYLQAGSSTEAIRDFRRAYELDERNLSARVRLAAAYLFIGDTAEYEALLPAEELAERGELWRTFVNDNLIVQVASQLKRYDLLEEITSDRISLSPDDSNLRVNLAALYYEQGDKGRAIEILEQAIEEIPSFRADGEALIKQLRAE